MKTRFLLFAALMFALPAALLKAQVVNPDFGKVKGFTGHCKVVIVDSTADAITEYSFEGPATLRKEIDMSPYNASWPNPSIAPGGVNTTNMEEMMKSSKAQDDKYRVWRALVKVKRQVKYHDGTGSADYVCTFTKTEMLKLQIAIIGSTVSIVPEVTFPDKLNCSGTRDGIAVLPTEDHRLMPGNFKITQTAPTGGGKRLTGNKRMTDGTQRMTAQWDFSPL